MNYAKSSLLLAAAVLLSAAPAAAQAPLPPQARGPVAFRYLAPAPATEQPATAAALPLASPLVQDTVPAPWSWKWMGWGFVGGAVAGPVGTALAYNRAGRGEGLEERIRSRRKESAFVGGMLGTAIFAYVLLQVVDLPGIFQGNGDGQQPDPA